MNRTRSTIAAFMLAVLTFLAVAAPASATSVEKKWRGTDAPEYLKKDREVTDGIRLRVDVPEFLKKDREVDGIRLRINPATHTQPSAFIWRPTKYLVQAIVCSPRLTSAAIKFFPNFGNHQNDGEGYRVLVAAHTCKTINLATLPEAPGAAPNEFQVTTSYYGELGPVLHAAQWPVGAWR